MQFSNNDFIYEGKKYPNLAALGEKVNSCNVMDFGCLIA